MWEMKPLGKTVFFPPQCYAFTCPAGRKLLFQYPRKPYKWRYGLRYGSNLHQDVMSQSYEFPQLLKGSSMETYGFEEPNKDNGHPYLLPKLLAKFICHCIHEATGDESDLWVTKQPPTKYTCLYVWQGK